MENSACFVCRNTAKLICHCKIAPVLFCFHCFQVHSANSPQTLHLTSSIDSEFSAKRNPSGDICMCGSSSMESCMFCKYSLENKKRRLFDSKEYYQKDLFTISDQILLQMTKNLVKVAQFKTELHSIADNIIKKTQSWLNTYLANISEIEQKIEQITKGVQSLKLTQAYDESNYIHWYIKDLIDSPESLQNISLDLFDYKFLVSDFESLYTNMCSLTAKQLISPSLCYFHPGSNKCTVFNLSSNTQSEVQVRNVKNFHRGASWCKVYDQKYFYCGGEDKKISDSAWLINPFESSFVELPNMIFPRSYHSVVYFNQNLFVFGGHSLTGRLNACEKYSFERAEWVKLPKMLQARSHFTACLFRDKIYIAGGCGSSTIEKFCPYDSKFAKIMINLPHQSYWTMACSNSEKILIFQGTTLLTFSPEDTSKLNIFKIVNNGGWWSELTPTKFNSSYFFFRKNLFISFNQETNQFKEEYSIPTSK